MRKLLFLLSVFSISVFAQPDKVTVPMNIPCFPTKTLMAQLKDKFGEEPMFMGDPMEEEEVKTAVFVSQSNNTYTIVQFDSRIACVLSIGNNVKYRFPKSMSKSSM